MTLCFNSVVEIDDIVVLVLQVLLPLIGLLIRKKLPTISKIITLSTLPLVILGFKNMFNNYYEDSRHNNLLQYFVFGNSFGVVEVALAINIKRLEYKMILSTGLLIVKLIAFSDGYENTSNWVGGIGAVFLLAV